jgi:pyruvate kinase
VAGYRFRVPVVAVTHEDRVYRQLAFWWGVVPVKTEFVENTDDLLAENVERLKTQNLVQKNDTILMLSGHSIAATATNMLQMHTVSRPRGIMHPRMFRFRAASRGRPWSGDPGREVRHLGNMDP